MHAGKRYACERYTARMHAWDARLGHTSGMHAYKMHACERYTPRMRAWDAHL